MKLYHVRVYADAREFKYKVSDMEVKETPKAFVGIGRRIAKEKLMKIETIWTEQHRLIHYHTYCLEGQQQQAIDMLKEHVVAKANQYKAEIDAVLAAMNRGFSH